MTKGQVEAKISEVISKSEIAHMGRGPAFIFLEDKLKGPFDQSICKPTT